MKDDRVFSSKANREKQYSSAGTGLRRLFTLGVIALILAIIWMTVAPLRRALQLTTASATPTNFLYVDGKSLKSGGSEAHQLDEDSLKDRALVAQSGDNLWIAQARTRQIGRIVDGSVVRWHTISQQFDQQDRILSLSPGPNGSALAVIQDYSDTASVRAANRATRTMIVRPEGTVEQFLDGVAARASSDGKMVVARGQDGSFNWRENGQETVLSKFPEAMVWDADFTNKVVCAAENSTVHVIADGNTTTFVPALMHEVIDLRCRPDQNQVWLSVRKPFGGSAVYAFDYSGNLVELMATSDEATYGPFTATAAS